MRDATTRLHRATILSVILIIEAVFGESAQRSASHFGREQKFPPKIPRIPVTFLICLMAFDSPRDFLPEYMNVFFSYYTILLILSFGELSQKYLSICPPQNPYYGFSLMMFFLGHSVGKQERMGEISASVPSAGSCFPKICAVPVNLDGAGKGRFPSQDISIKHLLLSGNKRTPSP